MPKLSRLQCVMLACAPLFGAAGLLAERAHTIGPGETNDAGVGALMGVGIGLAFLAVIKRQVRC